MAGEIPTVCPGLIPCRTFQFLQLFLTSRIYLIKRKNTQVPPQPMPEIPETHLYYTKVLLPPLNLFYL